MTVITIDPPSAPTPVREWQDACPVDAVLLVRDVERRQTRAGASFLRLTLADRSGKVAAVLWDASEGAAELTQPGAPVHVLGRFAEHPRYGRQVTVSALRRPSDDDVAWDQLLAGPQRPAIELEQDLDSLIGSIEDEHVRGLLERLLDADSALGRAYRRAPAAKYNHHAYRTGCSSTRSPWRSWLARPRRFAGIDRDLAVCGALLHDIGKLEAYGEVNGYADLTDAGKLEGEISLGYYRVRREIDAMAGFPPERAQALAHIILAHHGRLEHGSPVLPATREAALVHAIDNLSGQLGAFERLETEAVAGERWSAFDRMLGTCAFLPCP